MSESSSLLVSFLAAPVVGVILAGQGLAALARTGQGALATMDSAAEIEQRMRSRLADMAPVADAASPLARAEAAARAFQDEPVLTAVSAALDPGAVSRMEAELAAARKASEQGLAERTAAASRAAEAVVADVVASSWNWLAQAQRQQTVTAFTAALSAMGYEVDKATGTDQTVVHGESGDRQILALIRTGGRVDTDMAGFEGGECLLETQRLHAELTAQGVCPRRVDPVFHGRREGGVMLAAAARYRREAGITLAQAVLAQSSRPATAATPTGKAADRRSGSGADPAQRALTRTAPAAAGGREDIAPAVAWLFGQQGQRWM